MYVVIISYHDFLLDFLNLVDFMVMIFNVDYEMIADLFKDLFTAIDDATAFGCVFSVEGLRKGISCRQVFRSSKDTTNINDRKFADSKTDFHRKFNAICNVHVIKLRLNGKGCLNCLSACRLKLIRLFRGRPHNDHRITSEFENIATRSTYFFNHELHVSINCECDDLCTFRSSFAKRFCKICEPTNICEHHYGFQSLLFRQFRFCLWQSTLR